MKLRHPLNEIKRITTSVLVWDVPAQDFGGSIVVYSTQYGRPPQLEPAAQPNPNWNGQGA